MKPIYGAVEGVEYSKNLIFNAEQAAVWVNCIKLLAIVILENIHNLIGLDEVRT